jgi:hypothetical protein
MATPYTSQRLERIKQQKRTALKNKILTVLAIAFFILAIGYVGEQDRQTELLEQGYTLQEARAK